MSFLLNPFAFAVAGGDFESIATVTVGGGGAAEIEFTSIPSTYQHLQIRAVMRTNTTGQDFPGLQFNGSNIDRMHFLYGSGSAAESSTDTGNYYGVIPKSNDTANAFGVAIIDILDYASTSKNKVARYFWGYDTNGGGQVGLSSTLRVTTSAITSLKLITFYGTSYAEHCTAALYGVKAP